MDATPAAHDLAQRVLALESGIAELADTPPAAPVDAFGKLHARLARLVGVSGSQALLSRSLALARIETRWLADVHIDPLGRLVGLQEAATLQSAPVATAGIQNLMAQWIGLLITFIGIDLTTRILSEVWPEIAPSGLISISQEASS
jgi:hypothetical protein